MSTFGKIKEYLPDQEKFTSYLERIELFFEANDIAEENKVPVFLTVVGVLTNGLLCNRQPEEQNIC